MFWVGMNPSSSAKYIACARMMPLSFSLYHVPATATTFSRRRSRVVTTGVFQEHGRPAGVRPSMPPRNSGLSRAIRLPSGPRQTGVRKPRSSTRVRFCGSAVASNAERLLSSGTGAWLKVRKNQACTV